MTDMHGAILRDYDPARDRSAAQRIWREAGWIESRQADAMVRYIESGRATVAEIDGEAECLVCTAPGDMRYLGESIPFAAVTGVTTSRIARKQGLAGRLLARTLAQDAEADALVAGLGMFEQGYYDSLGFGTLGYEHILGFDPAHLTVPKAHRIPRRLDTADFAAIHQARLDRKRFHGSVNIFANELTRFEMQETERDFGVGYFDSDGRMTHGMWVRPKSVESGPYRIVFMMYESGDGLLELMSLIRSWGDQVHLVHMPEPSGIQMQDLLRQPIKHRKVTERGKFAGIGHAVAYFQMRMLDVPGCLNRTHLSGETVRFNLELTDPIEQYLACEEGNGPLQLSGGRWRGTAGRYVVTLGSRSSAEPGADSSLDSLHATVNAFTRLWLGVRPASGLRVTDSLSGPTHLIDRLDILLRLPSPRTDWDF